MSNLRKLSVGALALSAAISAQAVTFATFADPSPGEAQPLFTITPAAGNTLSVDGGWSGTGLTLILPMDGLTYTNAKFSLAAPLTGPNGVSVLVTGGQINFTTSTNAPIFSINFTSAELSAQGLGGNNFQANGVTFTGPAVLQPLTNQVFSFAFANLAIVGGNQVTATASFTSSADPVPEPAPIAAFAIGGLALLRRRKS